MAGAAEHLGIYGFGAAAHIVAQVAAPYLELAPKVPIVTQVETVTLSEANIALDRLRAGRLTGAAVLVP